MAKKASGLAISLILLFSLVPILNVSAQAQVTTGWKNEGIYGGRINCILIDPNSYDAQLNQSTTLYIGTQNGDKLFKSNNSGQTWQKIGPVVQTIDGGELRFNHIWAMAADSNDTKIIYVADGGLQKTTDGGTTWVSLEAPDVQDLAIDPVNPQTIYVVGSGTGTWNWQPCVISKSEDGGNRWTKLTTINVTCHPDLIHFMLHPNDSDTLFLALLPGSLCPDGALETPGGILKISVSGKSWEWVLGGSLEFGAFNIAFSLANKAWYAATITGVYKSIDDGNSWNLLKDFGGQVLSIATDSDGGIYAGVCEQGIYRSSVSTDGEWTLTGFNLDLFDAPNKFECYPRYITIDPKNPEVIYVRCWSSLFKSQDGGNTWASITEGITASRIFHIEKCGETFYTCGETALYQRTGSEKWSKLLAGIECLDLAIDSANPKRMAVSMSTFGNPRIKLAEDGGENWQDIVIPLDYGIVIHERSIVIDSGTIYLAIEDMIQGTDGGVLKGTKGEDGNYVWEAVSENYFPHIPVNTLAMDPENTNVLYAGIGAFQYHDSPGGIWKTENSGKTWENVSNGLPVECVNSMMISPNKTQTLWFAYAAIGNEVYKSKNGSSWEYCGVLGNKVTSLAFDPANPEVIYAATVIQPSESKVFQSTDSGDSWTEYCTINYEIYDILVGSLYAATSGGLWRYVAPTTGGTTTNWWLVGGLVAGMVAVGAIVYLVAFRRKSMKVID